MYFLFNVCWTDLRFADIYIYIYVCNSARDDPVGAR